MRLRTKCEMIYEAEFSEYLKRDLTDGESTWSGESTLRHVSDLHFDRSGLCFETLVKFRN